MTAKMTPALCRLLAPEIEAALKVIAAKHGLTVKTGGGKYDSASFTPKMTFSILDEATGIPADFALNAPLVGLTKDDYNRTFVNGGTTYAIVGINLRAPRFPIIVARQPDGKRFKYPEESVKSLLTRSKAA